VSGPAAPLPAAAPSFRKIWVAGTAVLVALAVLIGWESPVTAGLQARSFDIYQSIAPRQIVSTPATVVAIDEKSLAALGQWPWPRTVLADLIRAIARHRPAAIGIDILMPEPDRWSPERLLARARPQDSSLAQLLAALPSNDAELGRAIAAAPVVVALTDAAAPTGKLLRVPPVTVSDSAAGAGAATAATPRLVQFAGAIGSVDEIDGAAAGHGVISVGHAEDVIRRIPLFIDIGGTRAPALSIEMLRVAVGEPYHRLFVAGPSVQGFAVGDRTFRTERDGAVRVYYSPRAGVRFVSAIDVLNGEADPVKLESKLVLIGLTGVGLLDYKITPLGQPMPGSEIHAQLLENLLDDTLLDRPRWAPAFELAVFVLLGALLIRVTPRWSPRDAALLALGCVALPAAAAYVAFRTHRLLFDVAMPGLGLMVLFGILLVFTLAEAARQRKSLEAVVQAQREQAAYVAGELEAAQRIQTGILPRADLLRNDRRIDLAATMATAREVGGDLYDFYPLDDHRLFFLIGDVSGKGLSASIFMAVSKALYKTTVLRAAEGSIGEYMSEANAEVSRDNSEQFFVTAFAGILDLESGELAYCNAGHDSPWVLVPGVAGAPRLEARGGPPLCAIDHYAYRSARYRMRPGELLCLVTDGVTEAQNPAGDLYGSARVQTVLARLDAGRTTPQAVVDAEVADLATFVAGAERSDDLTLLVLRWIGPSATAI
jgi:serine phosphatase RsbU (regulator of sigma subunit)